MNSKPFQLGITGGIGTGKSLICKIFACLGVPVYDADSRAKSIMTTDGILTNQIKKEFGDLAYDENGRLNREYLSQMIFKDETKREALNKLVHPRVAHDTDNWLIENREHPYVVREAALLIESGAYKKVNKVLLVTAPDELRIKRVLLRDPHRSRAEISTIMNAQMPEAEKRKVAAIIIHNDETELLVPQLLHWHKQFSLMN